jgi:hypothetical protein
MFAQLIVAIESTATFGIEILPKRQPQHILTLVSRGTQWVYSLTTALSVPCVQSVTSCFPKLRLCRRNDRWDRSPTMAGYPGDITRRLLNGKHLNRVDPLTLRCRGLCGFYFKSEELRSEWNHSFESWGFGSVLWKKYISQSAILGVCYNEQ